VFVPFPAGVRVNKRLKKRNLKEESYSLSEDPTLGREGGLSLVAVLCLPSPLDPRPKGW
jgi:hypothetical protein